MKAPAFGQLTIFDVCDEHKLRPCDYRFKRYVGQRVILHGVYKGNSMRGDAHGVIHTVLPYYTIVETDGGFLFAGTPTNTAPDAEE